MAWEQQLRRVCVNRGRSDAVSSSPCGFREGVPIRVGWARARAPLWAPLKSIAVAFLPRKPHLGLLGLANPSAMGTVNQSWGGRLPTGFSPFSLVLRALPGRASSLPGPLSPSQEASLRPAPHPAPRPPDLPAPCSLPRLVLACGTERERPLLGPARFLDSPRLQGGTPSLPEDAKNILVASPGRAHSLL